MLILLSWELTQRESWGCLRHRLRRVGQAGGPVIYKKGMALAPKFVVTLYKSRIISFPLVASLSLFLLFILHFYSNLY